MTREDAIIFLTDNILDLPEIEKEPNFKEAVKMGIEALQQEPIEVEATKLQEAYNKGFCDAIINRRYSNDEE